MSQPNRIAAWLLPGLTLLAACEKTQGALCKDSFNRAQGTVNGIDARSLDSVKASLDQVDAALSACQAENEAGEVEQLKAARAKIGAHYEWLKSRAPKQREPTPEQLEAVQKDGDPDCPKGMAYKQRQTGKEVRCVGPVPANMPYKQAASYFERRDFKVGPGDDKSELKAEYGAELLLLRYERQNSTKPPKCVMVYPPPGMGWEEATARATGARIDRIKEGEPVKAGQRSLKLSLVNEPNKLLVKLGDC